MTPPQYMQALARAQEVRFARAEVRHAIRGGRMTIREALAMECCQSMPVGVLLAYQHRWGSHRVRRVLHRMSVVVGETRLVRDLTDRQREALIGACAPKGKTR